jgi:mannose-1-phosphate guanylyltransferase
MAGGIGSRFWPESSPEMPKQFLDILGVGKTLIQQTYERFVKIIPNKNILIVTSEKYFDIVKQQIPDILDENILTEPMRRNTAPCILYAALKIKHKNSVANVVVTPADHLILNETEFLKDIEEGICFSEKKNGLITLGITPNRPATTYGYIKRGENLNDCNFYKILNFTEKPNSDLAKQFIQDGNYLWNAGIFVWNNDLIINEIKKNLPEIYQKFENDIDFSNQENEKKSIEKIYDKINGISIDFGVMEKSNNVFVKKTDFGWSDLGTWDSIYQLKEKDQNENVILAQKIILENSNGNFIKSNNNNKILAIRDLEDFIVIDTNDVVLICKRENEQKIQDLLTEAKNKFSNGF